MTAVMALGGSTNAVIHLIALARRSGVPWTSPASTRSHAAYPSSPTYARAAST